MESILLVVHVIVALFIVALIMLQQGKGAEMGASFGSGGSQTVFGAAGTGNFFSRMTGIFVAIFFATSFILAMIAQSNVAPDDEPIPVLETMIDDVPSIDIESATGDVPELSIENSVDEVAAPVDNAALETSESKSED